LNEPGPKSSEIGIKIEPKIRFLSLTCEIGVLELVQ
jgi:hypothetical protein